MHIRSALLIGSVAALASCATVREAFDQSEPATDPAPAREGSTQAAQPVEERFPSAQASTVEDFDLTTEAERAAATTPSGSGGERNLGSTVASLGDVAEQGFWLETPLVDAETEGRVVDPKSGTSANVTLRPIPGEAGAGSRISLAAMRLLEVPITDLPTLEVYAGG